LNLLAKTEVAEPFAARTAQNPNLHIAADLGLVQGHSTVDFQIECKFRRHLPPRSTIETGLQQENWSDENFTRKQGALFETFSSLRLNKRLSSVLKTGDAFKACQPAAKS
jgi:hypothetical protein